ncbi:MAG: hypothetical protein QXS38_01240 [Candidatus Pacearchaeota archaeon]
MSTTDRWGHTWVYSDGTVSGKEIPGKMLLFMYNFEEPDHPYVRPSQRGIEVRFGEGISAEQLKKQMKNLKIDIHAKRFVMRRIEKRDFSSGGCALDSLY